MNDTPYYQLLTEPSALWASNCDDNNAPEIVRCAGVADVSDIKQITFFISEAFGKKFIQNLQPNTNIALAATCVPSFESYQYKGTYQSIRPCTEEEQELQRQYFDAFTDITTSFGFLKEPLFQSYFHQPSFAVTFNVRYIFEQTPHKGTGRQVIDLEDNK